MSTTINITETAVNVVVTEETINIEASGGQGPVGPGVPAGGTAGQILAKINSTNYNTQWINNTDLVGLTSVGVSMPSAFSVANSPLTANGTIAVTGSGTALQYINGLGNLVTFPSLSGYVTAVTGTSPIASSGGTTPAISIAQATTSVSGFLSSTDWNTFNNKQNALTNPITGTGTTNTLPKFTGASALGNSNITDSGSLITLGSATTISSGGLQVGTNALGTTTIRVGKNLTGATDINSVLNDGAVQSDVTSNVYNYRSGTRTAAASFTLTSFTHFFTDQASIGAGSSITTQQGFVVNTNMIGATNNYGFRGLIPSGANRWNLYMDGTANNYMAGSLGIGTTSLTNHTLSLGKTITGGTTATGINSQGQVQSDVTASALYNSTFANTQAASFTLGSLVHYIAQQGTFGAGSIVSFQVGFNVASSLIGATNNYGFRGQIPSGTNRWNIYMDGTAANYMAGDTGIGTSSLGTATQLTIGGTETAVSAIARGQLINTTLVASANGDTTIGLDIAPTFTNGAFTGVRNIALRSSGDIQVANNANINGLKTNGQPFVLVKMDSTDSVVVGNNQSAMSLFGVGIEFRTGAGLGAKLFNTNNLVIQNAGTYVDAGYRLDVNGDTRIQGTLFGQTYRATTSEGYRVSNDNGFYSFFNTANATRNAYVQATSTQLNIVAEGASSAISFNSGGIVQRMRLFQSGNLTIQNGGTFTDIASANLAVNSTTQGFLPPRMTTTEKNAISSPATGLVVFDTTLGKLCVFATTWQTISSV